MWHLCEPKSIRSSYHSLFWNLDYFFPSFQIESQCEYLIPGCIYSISFEVVWGGYCLFIPRIPENMYIIMFIFSYKLIKNLNTNTQLVCWNGDTQSTWVCMWMVDSICNKMRSNLYDNVKWSWHLQRIARLCGTNPIAFYWLIFFKMIIMAQMERIIVMTFLVRECYGSPKKQEF